MYYKRFVLNINMNKMKKNYNNVGDIEPVNEEIRHMENNGNRNEVNENEEQPNNNHNVCMTCLSDDAQDKFIVLPCGHAWLCGNCVQQLQVPLASCPVCRCERVTFQRMFFA